MTLSNLEQTVFTKAQSEADALLHDARKAADAHWEKESSRLRDEHKHALDAMQTQLQSEIDRQSCDCEAQERLGLLKAKNQIIADAFSAAVQNIRKLPNDGYRNWLRLQLQRLPTSEPLQVVANKDDAALVGQLLKEVNRSNLTLSPETAAIAGGFLARGSRNDLDFSIEAVVSVLKESLAEEVAKRLFTERS